MSKTIPQLDPAISLAGTNKIEISQSDSPSSTSVYGTLDQVISDVVNQTAQISESQVTNLTDDLASKLSLSGGTMTGELTLNSDPISDLEAATKQYVDNAKNSVDLQTAYNNSSSPQTILCAVGAGEGFFIKDPTSNTLLGISTLDSTNYEIYLNAQSDVKLGNISNGGYTQFMGNSIVNYVPTDFGVDNPNFTFNFYSDIPTITACSSANLQSGFSDESSNPSGFFKLTVKDQNVDNNILYATGTAGGNSPRVGIDGQLTVGIPYGSSSTKYAQLQLNSTTQGFLPNSLDSTQENSLVSMLGSSEAGLTWYNHIYGVQSFWDGADKQQLLSLNKIIQGSNMIITPNVDGSVVFDSSGGGSPGTQVQGSFTSSTPSVTTAVSAISDLPIAVSPGGFNPVNPVGTNVTTQIVSGVTTAIIQNTATGGRWCQVDFDLTMYIPSGSGQEYRFTVYTNTGFTQFFKRFILQGSTPAYKDVSICAPMVYLNTNDYVYLTVSGSGSSLNFNAYYFNGRLIDTTIASLPGTGALPQTGNNWYLTQDGGATLASATGTIINGNLTQFSGTGGLIEDAGVALSDISFQYIYNNAVAGYVEIDLTSAPTATFSIYNGVPSDGQQDVMTASNNGIYTFYGLAFRSSSDSTWFRLNYLGDGPTDPVSTIAQLYSTQYGAMWYPAMTITQRDAINITSALPGWGIYNLDQNTLNFYDGTNKNPVVIFDGSTSSTSGNLPQFSNTSGKVIDSGIIASNVIQSSGSYSNPSWITSLASSKITGLSANSVVVTNSSGILSTSNSDIQLVVPNFGGLNLTNNNSPLTGQQTNVAFSSSLSYGNYINFGSFGPYMGIDNPSNGVFLSGNLLFDVSATGYVYANAAASGLLKVNNAGIQLQHAVSGTSGSTATLITDFYVDTSGNVNFPHLTASQPAVTDGSKNLVSAGFSTSSIILSSGAYADPAWITSLDGSKLTASSVDLTTKVTGILPGGNGGTNNSFFQISGPNTSIKTFTLPNASASILTDNAGVTVGQGGTGQTTYTNGQLLIGNTTGNTLTKATLTGTTNQVSITNGAGSITLSLPQNINTTASPTFNQLTLQASSALTITSATNSIRLENNAGLQAKNSVGTYETFMFPRFSDNVMYIDMGSSGLKWRQNGGANALTVDASANLSIDAGNMTVSTAGKGYNIKSGSNARVGVSAILVAGTTTVSTTAVTTGDIVLLTCTTASGTQGIITVSISTGASFTLTSSNASDTSTYAWIIIRPT